jgi:signal transduction histidine kinase
MPDLHVHPTISLADFIRENKEPILSGWEAFARSIWPGGEAAPDELRDHAWDMLLAVATDINSPQSLRQQAEKSKGIGESGKCSDRVDSASGLHAISRVESGFDIRQLVAEYRALRASVIHLWAKGVKQPGPEQLEDLIRFNEAIDQLLATSLITYVEKVDQSREIFLGVLCHDLRSPMQAATMLAGLVSESTDTARSRLMAGQLSGSLKVIAEMISDLGDFTGTRLGSKMSITKAAMDFGALCREVIAEIQAVHPQRDFNLKQDGDLNGIWDRARLRQMLTNLLRNAIQHGDSNGSLVLSAMADGSHLTLAITNQGSSIPLDRMESIFEPMRRHETPTSHREPGSIGLGLYIAREVCTAHGGTIHAECAGGFTTFSVSLPNGLAAIHPARHTLTRGVAIS